MVGGEQEIQGPLAVKRAPSALKLQVCGFKQFRANTPLIPKPKRKDVAIAVEFLNQKAQA